ncbi:MAG: peptidoglycan DD-metalloendopeptidase family protein [Dehalococcoidia bacterium]|nr:peptidoglycan DD-metalloendopeptidase family protein [Dehalococcoidia bacterium]
MKKIKRIEFIKRLGLFASLAMAAPVALFIRNEETPSPETKTNQFKIPKYTQSHLPRVADNQYFIDRRNRLSKDEKDGNVTATEEASLESLRPRETTIYSDSPDGVQQELDSSGINSTSVASEQILPISYEYIIRPGDNLTAISKAANIDLDYIIWNNVGVSTPDRIYPGVLLRIPTVPGIIHAVRYGENLTEIAEQYGSPMVDIINFKGNQIESPDNIPVGKEIQVPGGRKSINITAWDGSLTTLDWNWPVTSRYITSKMDWRHPLGIDIGTQNWDEVYSARDGIVAFAGGDARYSYGYYIIVDHGYGYESLYAHLARNSRGYAAFNVRVGERVSAGDLIAWIGMTGRTTGPHIHFEISRYNNRTDPLGVLPNN